MDKPNSTPVNILFDQPLQKWWADLKLDVGDRAILRRCATLDEVAMSAPYQRFYRYMLGCGWPDDANETQRDGLAAIAGLMAHVKASQGGRLPEAMSPLGADKPLVSEMRFRALLRIDAVDDLFAGLRRVLPIIGHQANVSMLANDVYWWGDGVKKEWAYGYRWPAK